MAFSSKLVTLNRLKTAFSQFITSCTGKPSDASGVSGATLAAKINTLNNGYASSAGNAASADKLNSNAGDTDTPVYFKDGKPVPCTGYGIGSKKEYGHLRVGDGLDVTNGVISWNEREATDKEMDDIITSLLRKEG